MAASDGANGVPAELGTVLDYICSPTFFARRAVSAIAPPGTVEMTCKAQFLKALDPGYNPRPVKKSWDHLLSFT